MWNFSVLDNSLLLEKSYLKTDWFVLYGLVRILILTLFYLWQEWLCVSLFKTRHMTAIWISVDGEQHNVEGNMANGTSCLL